MTESTDRLYLIPHTHWEGAVFKTREAYLEMGLPNILRALRLLKAYPEYRFTLDQVCYVKPFLERYPEEEAAFRRFVNEGRLALVGGTDVMLDVNMPGGESFVRQVLYGKGYFRREFGVDITSSWQLDTFGHHAQMPQLLKLAGFQSFWFFRGVASWETPSEFYWEGLDGSQIQAFWLPFGYCFGAGSAESLADYTTLVRNRWDGQTPFTRGDGRVVLAGYDVSEPEEALASFNEPFNAQPDKPCHLQLAVPADFEAAMAQRPEMPVVTGELNPIFQGIYSSRIELKQRTRELERLLITAEELGAILQALGAEADAIDLWRAWEPMLFNQAHDLMSGVMTDHVYDDSIWGYEHSRRIAEEAVQTRLQMLIARIDTRGEGIPLVVFNALGWARTDIVTATVGFSDPNVNGVKLIGSDGQTVTCQMVEVIQNNDGGLLQATVAFVAQEVPALGYAVYHVIPSSDATPKSVPVDTSALENECCRLEVDRATGAITALTVKEGNWNALRGPANVVAMETDHGDFWEPYKPLDGASRIAMTDRHEPPQPGAAVFSTDRTDAPGTITQGPVVSEFTVSHPMSEQGRFQTSIRLYAGLRRIDIRTTILNHDTFVRYRALFPTMIDGGKNMQEIPFGAIERPDGIEFPAQNWVDFSDGQRGLALLNRGLPGNNIAGHTMMLSLLRSTQIVSYGFGGGYEPGMGSESGFELGKELTFDYALLPHAGDWQHAAVYRDGLAFNHPLLACTATVHPGALPQRWGLLEISHPNVIVSALKVGENGRTMLRVYEAAGMTVDDVTITFTGSLHKVEEVNLMEDPLQPLNTDGKRISFSLRPFEIKTIGFDVHIEHKG
ncbi:MAG: alpha-mannosidase [Armatimonadota bacterium]